MPYIKSEDRDKFRKIFDEMPTFESPGEFNYFISCLMLEYLHTHGKSYTNINALVGVLECVKLEFYRRLAASYEDDKLKENGDVY